MISSRPTCCVKMECLFFPSIIEAFTSVIIMTVSFQLSSTNSETAHVCLGDAVQVDVIVVIIIVVNVVVHICHSIENHYHKG